MSTQYARRTARIPLRSPVMVTLPDGGTLLGELCDLSAQGAGLVMPVAPGRLPVGLRVKLLIEAPELPDPDGDGGVLALSAVITRAHSGSGVTGMGPTRFGVEFAGDSRWLGARLRASGLGGPTSRLGTGTGPGMAIPLALLDVEPVSAGLAANARGRERLFQHALECLQAGQHERTVEVIGWALATDAKNGAYLGLRHVALGELAYGRGDLAAAASEAAAAKAHAPRAPEVTALLARLDDGTDPAKRTAKGFLSRLFGR